MKRTTGAVLTGGGHTIRGRIIRMVTLPLVAMIVLLSFFSAGEVSSYRGAAATEERVTVILAMQGLVQELQNERGYAVALLAGAEEFRAQLGPARRQVDSRRRAVAALLTDGGTLEDQAAEPVSKLDGLAEVRGGIDTGVADEEDTFEFYSTLIEELSANTRHLSIVSDEALRRGAESVEQLIEVREATAQERVFLRGVFSAGGFRDGEFSEFLDIVAARDLFLTELNEFATPATAAAMTALLNTGSAAKAHALEQAALGSGDGRKLSLSARSWWSELATVLDDLTRLAQRVGEDTQERARSLRQRATVRTTALAVVVLLCLAGSVALATAGTRALAGPLATLAGEANRLAEQRLPEAVGRAVAGDVEDPPEPVTVASGATSEVRQVAEALDRVQETAYNLATEQAQLRRTSAESLANLGRRNQNLLRRQLGFITRLEREESDPTGLANLFELDHLATRMRRNAESLLVLVGAASPRQWSGHAPLTDVIRAAVSEVEEYRRVILRRTDEVLVHGWIASGLAHMLAELIENGLVFSPPDVEVEIHGRRLGGGYLIAVCDQGIGMNEEDLRRANERLRGDGDFLTAPARFLGHYVVGRLAAEMGIEVELTQSPVTGVTARIQLPAGLLAEPAPVGATVAAQPQTPGYEPGTGADRHLTGPLPEPERQSTARIPVARERPRALEVDYVVAESQPVVSASWMAPGESPKPALNVEYLPDPGDAGRTPNGLRKRIPRERRPHQAVTAPVPGLEPAGPIADSPIEAGARLSALRDGMRRGTADRVGRQ
ncbi:sensor histidine kinase [Winogradskya humida]|uniref:histidine kinase n=1 Tax=Winogradskya humida TaxID=113566 RepID=A0ABQ3ZTI0_9ACTN|nr:nitrate- and nitrite sensing domain-containing protein [Actinoplanes humidus]GIE21852.1 ATPase [Actinoplanes humidus]